MEKGHYREYSGNRNIHKHFMENSVHDFETGHPVAGKYEAKRAAAFKMDDEYLSPVDGSDQNLDNSEEARYDASMRMGYDHATPNNYGMPAAKMSALKNRYSTAMPQSKPDKDGDGVPDYAEDGIGKS